MNRLFIMIFIVFSSSLYSQEETYSFSGTVYEYEHGNPLPGVNIIIRELNAGVATDIHGFFDIDFLSKGSYAVAVSCVGYASIKDTISLNTVEHSINKTHYLEYQTKCVTVEQTPKYEKYHLDLKVSAQKSKIIEFTIDSLVYQNFDLHFYSSFKNNTALSIYILQEKECIRPFIFSIYNSDSKKIKRNAVSLSCDTRSFYNPDSSDLIEILPYSTYQYKRTSVWLYSFENLPKDKYSISISYEFKSPMEITINRNENIKNYSSQMYVARISLRGKYNSINTIVFNN